MSSEDIRAVEGQFLLGARERLASRSGCFTLFLRITDFFIILQMYYLQCLVFCLHSLASTGF